MAWTCTPGGFGHGGDMIGYVAHMWADDDSGVGVVAFANGIRGAWSLAEAALAITQGADPGDPRRRRLPKRSSMTDPARLARSPTSGRYRAHNPWLPTFRIAARAEELVLGTDWMDAASDSPSRHSMMEASASAGPNGLPSACASTR